MLADMVNKMNNPALNARKGDTSPQNYIAFIVPLDSGTWESVYVFEHRPTNQDVCNAMVNDNKNPMLYAWQVYSLEGKS